MIALQKPSTSKKLFGLDHLRAAAIIMVFIYHYGRLFPHPEWANTISRFGWTGVDLFFVLSGYLISAQLFKNIAYGQVISFREFFIKRFLRIIPAYLFVVALYFFFPPFREREALAPLWKYLTFTQNIGLEIRQQGTFSHAWSLCIEEQFYLVLPLILIVLSNFNSMKKGYLLLITFFILDFLIRYYCWHNLVEPFSEKDNFSALWYKWIYYPTWGRLDGLLIGVSIAAILQFKPTIKNKLQQYGNSLLLTGLCILVIAYFLCQDQESLGASIFGFPLVAIGYGLLVSGAISATGFLYKRSSFITANIATLSYAIYLTHKIIIHLTQQQFSKFSIPIDGNGMFLICTITSFTGAFLVNRVIEKPFLLLRDNILSIKPAANMQKPVTY